MLKKIKHEMNYLQPADFLQVFLMVFSLPAAIIYKLYLKIIKKEIWLICEDPGEACDNGYCFFKYISENHPEVCAYYAIDYKAKAYEKVKKTGKTVKFGSIKHWIMYFCCKHNISSQKAGKPNAAVCYVLEVFGIIKSKAVFLQHGITINKAEWLFYENTKMRLFICGAKPEYDYVNEVFGYPKENVAYLGFNRFDDYHSAKVKKNQVLLIPSWREWIASKNEFSDKYEDVKDFTKTEYFQKYHELINDTELHNFLEENDLTLVFYPHRKMQKYIDHFVNKSERIRILNNETGDIRTLLMESAVMITDYSSVAMDFAYTRRPIIFYQFDEKRFREAQYAEGYFSYRTSGFGEVTETCKDTVSALKKIYEADLKLPESTMKAFEEFYPLYDDKNNERIFNAIKSLK